MSAGVAVTPSAAASLACSFVSMSRSRVSAVSCCRCWSMTDCWSWACESLSRPATFRLRICRSASSSRQRLDGVAIGELVLRDALAVDAPDGREVLVVPGQAGGDHQDEDAATTTRPKPRLR